ncbi:hypothetical protein [Nonomuraea sp. NPDC050643]|uniref:hypothetical protein n=1 Tax=Nonomuraea sp. NPDC050643 TaxID=3155660 RepID=UPI0033FA58EA
MNAFVRVSAVTLAALAFAAAMPATSGAFPQAQARRVCDNGVHPNGVAWGTCDTPGNYRWRVVAHCDGLPDPASDWVTGAGRAEVSCWVGRAVGSNLEFEN